MPLTDWWALTNTELRCSACEGTFVPDRPYVPKKCPLCNSANWPKDKSLGYEVVESSGCWLWLGTTSGMYGPHRQFYANAKGPIPDGYVVDHLCNVHQCINPDHLEAVPKGENSRRGGYLRHKVRNKLAQSSAV